MCACVCFSPASANAAGEDNGPSCITWPGGFVHWVYILSYQQLCSLCGVFVSVCVCVFTIPDPAK